LLGRYVSALDALGEGHLLLGGEQRHATDGAQIEAQRVEARLHAHVDLHAAQLLQARAQCDLVDLVFVFPLVSVKRVVVVLDRLVLGIDRDERVSASGGLDPGA
jgi:hypothetical protein